MFSRCRDKVHRSIYRIKSAGNVLHQKTDGIRDKTYTLENSWRAATWLSFFALILMQHASAALECTLAQIGRSQHEIFLSSLPHRAQTPYRNSPLGKPRKIQHTIPPHDACGRGNLKIRIWMINRHADSRLCVLVTVNVDVQTHLLDWDCWYSDATKSGKTVSRPQRRPSS